MYENIKKMLDNKDVLVLGYGREGKSTLSFINDFVSPKSVAVADLNDVSGQLPDGVGCISGKDYMSSLDDYDVIVKSPGVVYKDVSPSVLEKTTSQTDLFLREYAYRTVGITGTKGKSTTTTLIYNVLECAGMSPVLTGNIGIPPLDSARQMSEGCISVFEMSCHQLEFEKVSPHISVVLNLLEDHLDHYGTRENYIKAKENIFLHQSKSDYLVINRDCTQQIKKAPSRIITVGYSDADYCFLGGAVNETVLPTERISLIGSHNYFNISVAKAVCDILGVSEESFVQGVVSYKPLPHRLEYVATKNGVDYYDDSISTVSETTIGAIKALGRVESVIIGGMDRGIDYGELVDFLAVNPVKNIILIHESGKRIASMLDEKSVGYILTDSLESAVAIAYERTASGSQCVLSPASASYGYFKNFEERGDVFKMLVNRL